MKSKVRTDFHAFMYIYMSTYILIYAKHENFKKEKKFFEPEMSKKMQMSAWKCKSVFEIGRILLIWKFIFVTSKDYCGIADKIKVYTLHKKMML